LTKKINSPHKLGFEMNRFGKLVLASESAQEFLQLQTDDYFRKYINTKPMQQILLELAGLEWNEQTYDLATHSKDDKWAQEVLYEKGLLKSDLPKIVGLNIGSSLRHDAKRWPVENFYQIAKNWSKENSNWSFVVLSGPDDKDAYSRLEKMQNNHSLPNLTFLGTNNTISQFISLVNKIPAVISADTFGMHVAIALGKNVISLHGPQPEQEIYLYNKGAKVHLNIDCQPCFAPKIDNCINSQRLQCMREMNIESVNGALKNEIENLDQ